MLSAYNSKSVPLYRVTDRDGNDVAYQKMQQGGMPAIMYDADFADLTGTLNEINTLKARGVEKLVFVTKNATSTFALADLLAKGSTSDAYKLANDGKTVTFTLGAENTDVNDILEKA